MRYKTKLFSAFSVLVTLSTLLALLITYEGGSRLLLNQIRAQLLSVVVTSAASFNGDFIKQFQTIKSTESAAYQDLLNQLRFIRDSNRTSIFFIKYFAILKYHPDYNNFTFIADPEENPVDAAHFGDIMPPLQPLLNHLDQPFVVDKSYRDIWGTWFAAFAPIYDSQDQVAATLGAEIDAQYVYAKMRTLLLYGLIALLAALIVSLLIAHYLSKFVTNSLTVVCNGIEKIGGGDLNTRIHLNTKDEFDDLASAINAMAKGLEERNRLKAGFSRYVSKYVLDKILTSDKSTKLEGEKRKVTILFSDIRQFTTIAEQLLPEEVVKLLNEYFEKMITIIFAHNGTLDKFIGDGIMAEFGAPLDDVEQEIHAIRAAVHMQLMVKKLSAKWKQQGLPDITIGIGLHTGYAIVGDIGSNIRMEYTAIGDTVNVASRLESTTKSLHHSVIISEETYKAVHSSTEFTFKDLGDIHLTGRAAPIRAYAVLFDENQDYDFPKDFSLNSTT